MFDRFVFDGGSAVVTGATSGIGLAIASRLIDRGMHVIAIGRREERLQKIAEQLGDAFIPLAADLASVDSIDRIGESVQDHFDGRLRLLVNNAGVGAMGAFAEADPSRLRTLFEVDFFSAVELTRRLLPALKMESPSTVCNVGSVLGHCAVPNKAEYCAAKFAMHGWNDALRAEWKPLGISVTMVSPSTTRSEFFESMVQTDPNLRSRSVGSWSVDQVADAAVRAIHRRRREAILSWGGKALVYADRLFPDLTSRLLTKST